MWIYCSILIRLFYLILFFLTSVKQLDKLLDKSNVLISLSIIKCIAFVVIQVTLALLRAVWNIVWSSVLLMQMLIC